MKAREGVHGFAQRVQHRCSCCWIEAGGGIRSTLPSSSDNPPPTMTEAVDALEREGLVPRDPDPRDWHAKLVSITAEGRAATAETEPLRQQLVAHVFDRLSTDLRNLQDVLDQLSGALEDLPASMSL